MFQIILALIIRTFLLFAHLLTLSLVPTFTLTGASAPTPALKSKAAYPKSAAAKGGASGQAQEGTKEAPGDASAGEEGGEKKGEDTAGAGVGAGGEDTTGRGGSSGGKGGEGFSGGEGEGKSMKEVALEEPESDILEIEIASRAAAIEVAKPSVPTIARGDPKVRSSTGHRFPRLCCKCTGG